MRPPAHIQLFSLTRTEAGAALSACVAEARQRLKGLLCWKTRRSAERSRGLGEPHGLPVGNLSSHRQTLLSKVRDPKNLLEKTQLSGDKIGAMVPAVCNVPY